MFTVICFASRDFFRHKTSHSRCCQVIIAAIPEMDRDLNIFQAKTPGKSKKTGIPGKTAQPGTEGFKLGLDARFPDLGMAESVARLQVGR